MSSDLIEHQQRVCSTNNNIVSTAAHQLPPQSSVSTASASTASAITAQGPPQILQALSAPPGFTPTTFIPFEFVDFMNQVY